MDDLPSGTGKHEQIPLKVGVWHQLIAISRFATQFFFPRSLYANKSRATHRNNGHKMCFLFFFFWKRKEQRVRLDASQEWSLRVTDFNLVWHLCLDAYTCTAFTNLCLQGGRRTNSGFPFSWSLICPSFFEKRNSFCDKRTALRRTGPKRMPTCSLVQRGCAPKVEALRGPKLPLTYWAWCLQKFSIWEPSQPFIVTVKIRVLGWRSRVSFQRIFTN